MFRFLSLPRFTHLLTILSLLCSLFIGEWAQAQKKTKPKDILALPEISREEVIGFALYTVHKNTLKLTAQLYPLLDDEPRTVRLEVDKGNGWETIAKTQVIEAGWTAPFRVEKWDDTQSVPYRVVHADRSYYTGTIRQNPVDNNEVVVAAFTGNSIAWQHGGDIPRDDLIANVKKADADLLFFAGDQVYHHTRHYNAWMKFGRDFGEMMRDRPTITIPDDHDVGQPNLWGHGGRQSYINGAADGGYRMPVEYVQEVERAQTSHLPDPFDPTPIQRGIGVYYTDLNWGRISFAILEDRKFKTGPASFLADVDLRADHIVRDEYDPYDLDYPEAILLGQRQLDFLNTWGQDWDGADFKVALSQTIFAGGAHIHGKHDGRLNADLDSNGWPQTGRNKAIDALRKSYAFHLAGDQHLATIFHHGVNNFRDGIVSFCVPSIANLYLRWWEPLEPGKNRQPGESEILGDHYDGFNNKVTCYAVANPEKEPNGGDKLTTRAAGFGIVRFDKSKRTITMECWPRNVDISDPNAQQHKGWPKTIHQTDNYGREAVAWLPEINVVGATNPVVKITDDDTHRVVYTLRINGTSFQPKVFVDGRFTVELSVEGKKTLVAKGVASNRNENSGALSANFDTGTINVTSGEIRVDILLNGRISVNGKEMNIPFFENLVRQSDEPSIIIYPHPNGKTNHVKKVLDMCKKLSSNTQLAVQPKQ